MTFGSDPECVQALKQDRGDAYVQDETLLHRRRPEGPGGPDHRRAVHQPTRTASASSTATTQFKKFVNDWLKKIQADGLWQKAWKNSLGTVVQGEAPTPPADRLGSGFRRCPPSWTHLSRVLAGAARDRSS